MDMVTGGPPSSPQQLSNLITSLEQATLMLKHLPITTDPSQFHQIYTSLQSAHHHLSSFLSQTTLNPSPHQPSLTPPTPQITTENFLPSSMARRDHNNTDPMQVGDGDDDEIEMEQNLETSVARVEERMRDFFIKNKRVKRPLSPAVAEEDEQERRRRYEKNEFVKGFEQEFDPQRNKLRSLDLIYQFHG